MNCQTLQFRHVPHSHFKNLYYSSNCLDRTCLLLFLLCIKIQGAHIWIEIISISSLLYFGGNSIFTREALPPERVLLLDFPWWEDLVFYTFLLKGRFALLSFFIDGKIWSLHFDNNFPWEIFYWTSFNPLPNIFRTSSS